MGTKNLHVSTELHTQDLELLKGETLFTHGNWQVDFEDSTPQYTLLILYTGILISSNNDYDYCNVRNYTCCHKLSSEKHFQKYFRINLKCTN